MNYKDGEAGWIAGQGVPDSWRDSTNMEHVRVLYRMANESWRGSPELAALTAAIVSLSTQQSPADPVAADNEKAADRACLAMIEQGYYWNGEAWARAQAQGGDEAWLLDPRTIESKSQWDAVARALGADVDDPDAVLAAAKAWRAVFIAERAARYREGGKAIEQARIHAETDAACIGTLAAQQPPAEAHCTTCSCVPGMAPAVRFDTTPAEKDGAVRDHLIRMGWTPPAETRKGNTPIAELIADYESNGCDHSDMEWVRRAALHYVGTMQDSQVRCLLYTLASTPADEGFTAGDMMVARQEGRREAQRRAAMCGPAATLADRVDRVAALLYGHGPMAESAAANLRNALASYDVAIAGQQGGAE